MTLGMAVSQEKSTGHFWSATFLISGTCIGGGMLAMPVQTAESGFIVTFSVLILGWMLMTFTGLCLVEATLWFKNNKHFPSISENLLGIPGRVTASFIYLMMNYLSLIAYASGGAKLLDHWFTTYFGFSLGYELSCIPYVVIFGSIVAVGTSMVGKFNKVLMLQLIAAYAVLVFFGIPIINNSNLVSHYVWGEGWGIFSMVLATYSYQMVVPTVCSYVNYDAQQLRKIILTGTTIPLVVYSLWTLVVHGIVPLHGENGLREAFELGNSSTTPLSFHLNNNTLSIIADIFGFFAVTTSFLGLSLALFNFLEDFFSGFSMKLSKRNIILVTFIPTIILAIMFPRALVKFLDLSGGFGDTILSCLMPVAMVWIGRYKRKNTSEYSVFGGKPALIVAGIFSALILLYEFWKLV